MKRFIRRKLTSVFFKFLVILLGWTVFTISEPKVFAQKSTYKKYFDGKYREAEKEFKIFVKVSSSAAKKAQYYKMLGICQYMQGKFDEAIESFISAKKTMPNIKIEPNNVLDLAVIEFFDTIASENTEPEVQKEFDEDLARMDAEGGQKTYKEEGEASEVNVSNHEEKNEVELEGEGLYIDEEREASEKNTSKSQTESEKKIKSKDQIKNDQKPKSKYLSKSEKKIKSKDQIKYDQKPKSKYLSKSEKKIKAKDQVKTATKYKMKYQKKSRSSATKFHARAKPKPKSLKKIKRKESFVSIHYLLPFGAGQFANNNIFLGTVFLVSQASTLYYGVAKFNEAEKLVMDTNNEILLRDAERKNLKKDEQVYDLQVTREFRDARNNQAINLTYRANIGLALFGALWVASNVEAFLSDRRHKIRKMKRKTRSQKKSNFSDKSSLIEWNISPYMLPNSYYKYKSSPSVAVHLGVKF